MKKLSRHLLVQSQQWKHQDNESNLLKVNNKDTRKMCKVNNKVIDIVQVSLFSTLNIFQKLLWYSVVDFAQVSAG